MQLQRVDTEREQRGVGQDLDIGWRWPADGGGDAEEIARAGIANRNLASIWSGHIHAEQPGKNQAAARLIGFIVQAGAGGEINRESVVCQGVTQRRRGGWKHTLWKRCIKRRCGGMMLAGHGFFY